MNSAPFRPTRYETDKVILGWTLMETPHHPVISTFQYAKDGTRFFIFDVLSSGVVLFMSRFGENLYCQPFSDRKEAAQQANKLAEDHGGWCD